MSRPKMWYKEYSPKIPSVKLVHRFSRKIIIGNMDPLAYSGTIQTGRPKTINSAEFYWVGKVGI